MTGPVGVMVLLNRYDLACALEQATNLSSLHGGHYS